MRLTEKTQVGSQSKGKEIIRPPYLLILDSKGNLHSFRYSGPQSSQAKCEPVLLRNEFLKRKDLLKQRLKKKEKLRGKSQTKKVIKVQEKKRAKSPARINQSPLETKISYKFPFVEFLLIFSLDLKKNKKQ